MSGEKGNVVIAGDMVFAGFDEDDRSACTNAIVVEFPNVDELKKALQTGQAEFTVFESA